MYEIFVAGVADRENGIMLFSKISAIRKFKK